MDAVEKLILGELEIVDVKELTQAKNDLEIIKSSTRVEIYKNDKMIYLDKVPSGIKASVFLYDIQQQNKKLQNPAFIMILSALNLNDQSVMNTYAKHATSQLLLLQQKSKVPPNNQQVLTVPTDHPQAQKQSKIAEAPKVQAYSKEAKKKTTKKTLTRTERPITT